MEVRGCNTAHRSAALATGASGRFTGTHVRVYSLIIQRTETTGIKKLCIYALKYAKISIIIIVQ